MFLNDSKALNAGPVYGHAPKPVYHDASKPAVASPPLHHEPLYQIPRLPPPPVHHFNI